MNDNNKNDPFNRLMNQIIITRNRIKSFADYNQTNFQLESVRTNRFTENILNELLQLGITFNHNNIKNPPVSNSFNINILENHKCPICNQHCNGLCTGE